MFRFFLLQKELLLKNIIEGCSTIIWAKIGGANQGAITISNTF